MKYHFGTRGIALVAALGILTGGAQAVDLMPLLFNTGQDAFKTNQSAGAIDSHYSLVVNANSASSNALVEDTLPGTWIANTATSQWIGPTQNAGAGVAVGWYHYRYTLDLTGYVGSSASFTGRWSTDNNGVIYVNGSATTNTTSYEAFTAWHGFTLGTGLFTGGVNTIDFQVYNGGGPSGLRVEWETGSATPVPEPFTFGLTGAALILALRRWNRGA